MTTIKINEQIAFLRKQKGLTQENLARALGVTNQAVSKWESAQCCPDMQLLPELAGIFEVSIDELIGYRAAAGLGDICLRIKEHFSALPEGNSFEKAYRIAALLHEIASTDGYKKTVPWKEKDYAADSVSAWGLSVCSEPEGCTGRKNNTVFFSLSEGYAAPNGSQIRELSIILERFSHPLILKTLFTLYGLTVSDFDLYVTAEQIAAAAFLQQEEVETALNALPLTVREEEGRCRYRLDGAFSYLPPLLSFLCR